MTIRFWTLSIVALALLSPSVASAQDPGPQAAPPKYDVKHIPSEPQPGPPPIPQEQIIQKFSANEDVMQKAYDSYTFTQTVRMQEMGDPGGVFTVSGDVYSKPDGQRYFRVATQPVSTLKWTHFSLEDVREIASVPMFPLTTSEVANYSFKYAGEEKLDQLTTFIFQVKPKMLSRKKRYFEGVIWVDNQDFVIVKSYGKFVSEFTGNGLALPFTMFESYRENFQGKYWLPTYIRSDDYYKLVDDKPKPPAPVKQTGISDGQPPPPDAPADPVEELPLRLVIRLTDFKPQTAATTPSASPAGATADAPQKP